MTKKNEVSPRLVEAWLELQRAIKGKKELERLLHDKVTGLPTVPLLLPEIKKILSDYGELGLLCVNVVKYSRIEEIYGWRIFDEVMREIAKSLCGLLGISIRGADIVLEIMTSGNTFVIILSPPRKKHRLSPSDLDHIEERVGAHLESDLKSKISPTVYQKLGCYVGGAIIGEEKGVRLERLVHRGLEEALEDSGRREAKDAGRRLARLRQLIRDEEIHTLFQPMVNLKTHEIEGYEALSRGPAGEFERPDKLFKFAYEMDLVIKLERLCRKRALESAKGLKPGYLLFINVEPESVADPE
ncbi:MAG: EAL domain-containing protein, partial [Candidatus Subteraquimicrobiales bacterium]|nr:EAL domain-containing protein [Candidatus Subteraquimicrobiales bacterium]